VVGRGLQVNNTLTSILGLGCSLTDCLLALNAFPVEALCDCLAANIFDSSLQAIVVSYAAPLPAPPPLLADPKIFARTRSSAAAAASASQKIPPLDGGGMVEEEVEEGGGEEGEEETKAKPKVTSIDGGMDVGGMDVGGIDEGEEGGGRLDHAKGKGQKRDLPEV
jgi:hypothetical protein